MGKYVLQTDIATMAWSYWAQLPLLVADPWLVWAELHGYLTMLGVLFWRCWWQRWGASD